MKRILFFLITFFFLFIISDIFADDWDEIRKTAANIKSVSAKFTQEKHMKILAKPLISKGRFFFTAPRSLRWEYISPVKSILLMHNGKLKSYIKGKSGLVEDSRSKAQAMSIVMQEITSWLNGRFHDDPNFKATLHTGKISKIMLIPREESFSNIIKSIELQISKEQGIIKSVKIHENLDSYTLLRFNEVEHNKEINERLYTEVE